MTDSDDREFTEHSPARHDVACLIQFIDHDNPEKAFADYAAYTAYLKDLLDFEGYKHVFEDRTCHAEVKLLPIRLMVVIRLDNYKFWYQENYVYRRAIIEAKMFYRSVNICYSRVSEALDTEHTFKYGENCDQMHGSTEIRKIVSINL